METVNTLNIIWFTLVGVITALLAMTLMTPDSRRYGVGGLFILAILGALIGGLFFPTLGWFIAPITFIGLLILSFVGAILAVWLVSLILVLLIPVPEREIK